MDHEWRARVADRTDGHGCPYCSGHKFTVGNSFADLFPVLVKEWHPFKNGDGKPTDFAPSSHKVVWWLCEYGHEWKTTINSRTSHGTGCRKCRPQTSVPEIRLFVELKYIFGTVLWHKKFGRYTCDIYIPKYGIVVEYDGSYYHEGRMENDLSKNLFLAKKGLTIFRVRALGLEPTNSSDLMADGNQMTLSEVKALLPLIRDKLVLDNRQQDVIDKYANRTVFANDAEFNYILSCLPGPPAEISLAGRFPELIKEWNSERNLPLTPYKVTAFSDKSVWWKCNKGHEWEARIADRSRGSGCPDCAGKRLSEWNNLLVVFPQVAQQWNKKRNGSITPRDVTPISDNKVWWLCSQGHEWKAVISDRTKKNSQCPYCAGRKVNDTNNLAFLFPQLVEEWHSTRNGILMPTDFRPGSKRKVWWICQRGHEWEAVIHSRSAGSGCPYCSGQRAGGDNNLAHCYPRLAEHWHPKRNEGLRPENVTPGSRKKVWWICERGHEWNATVGSRTSGAGCPECWKQRRRG